MIIDEHYDEIEKLIPYDLNKKYLNFKRCDLKTITEFLKVFKQPLDDLKSERNCTLHKVVLYATRSCY